MGEFPRLILASSSPRRIGLLRQMGFTFQVMPSGVEENSSVSDPEERVKSLASIKAEAVLEQVTEGLIVAADTLVILENHILAKPRDPGEARKMLLELSGRTHEVFTGFHLAKVGGERYSDVERTRVKFRILEEWEVDAYVASGGPLDKAGGYGIQDSSGLFVERIEGCFYNVVGFPLTKFYEGLKRFIEPSDLYQILKRDQNR